MEIAKDRVRLSTAEAQTLSEEALRGIGYDAEEARIIADHVMDAALCGYEYSGLPKILNVAEHRQLKEPRRPMRALREPATGTNPIAFAFPTMEEPLVIDLGTSAFMGTDLIFQERRKAVLPEGVAHDTAEFTTRCWRCGEGRPGAQGAG